MAGKKIGLRFRKPVFKYLLSGVALTVMISALIVGVKLTQTPQKVTESEAAGCYCKGGSGCSQFTTPANCVRYGTNCSWFCPTPNPVPTSQPTPISYTCKYDCLPETYNCGYPLNGTCRSGTKCCKDVWGKLTIQKCRVPIGANTCVLTFSWVTRNLVYDIDVTENSDTYLFSSTLKSGSKKWTVSLGTHHYVLDGYGFQGWATWLDEKTVTITH